MSGAGGASNWMNSTTKDSAAESQNDKGINENPTGTRKEKRAAKRGKNAWNAGTPKTREALRSTFYERAKERRRRKGKKLNPNTVGLKAALG